MALRWIPYSRVSMQRAGMLVIAVAAASERRPIDLERASHEFSDVVSRKTRVPDDRRRDVASYLRSLRLWKRYGHLREDKPLTDEDLIEVQDLWLADPVLPAATGAVTPEVIEDIPQLAASLRLVRDVNFTRNDRGKALLATLTDEERAVLRRAAGAVAPNPLALTSSTQLLLLYALLDADGDFVRVAYETSRAVEGEFTRAEFASGLNVACRELAARHRPQMRTGRERKLLTRLEDWAREVDKPRGSGREWGGGRPPDQLATLRLEPFVDLSAVTRVDRYAYRYVLTNGQRAFFDQLIGADSVESFLRERLVASWCKARGENRKRMNPEHAWPLIASAYELVRSPLGQASFTEVTLLAIGRLLEAGSDRYFELQDGMDAITGRRREDPKRVRLGVNRRGELTYMKLSGGTR